MSFGNWYLLMLLTIPAGLLARVWRRKGGLVLPFDHGKPGTGRAWWLWATASSQIRWASGSAATASGSTYSATDSSTYRWLN